MNEMQKELQEGLASGVLIPLLLLSVDESNPLLSQTSMPVEDCAPVLKMNGIRVSLDEEREAGYAR